MDQYPYVCDVDAEPLHRYKAGGYHPIHLGETLKDGRYKILHKVGWGGYSTVWAARDQRKDRYVALKIMTSEVTLSRELEITQTISTTSHAHPGIRHLMSLLDHFQLCGPNGMHDCLAFELLGRSVPDLVERRFHGERIPAKLAKSTAKQTLLGLDCLHQQGIAHGDLYMRNLVFDIPMTESLTEEEFLQKLKPPEVGLVRRMDNMSPEDGMPRYLVWPSSFPADRTLQYRPIKIVDYGEAFFDTDVPSTLHTPLVTRAPEVIFGDDLSHRVDLWSMGCLLFELVSGQPPFDNVFVKVPSLVQDMVDRLVKGLPERWQRARDAMDGGGPSSKPGPGLQEWLEEVYFDVDGQAGFSREDIVAVGGLVRRLLRFEPSARASAKEILEDSWFQDE